MVITTRYNYILGGIAAIDLFILAFMVTRFVTVNEMATVGFLACLFAAFNLGFIVCHFLYTR